MRFRKFQIKSFVMQSGERYCLLFDKTTGMPLFYPNLFVTTQVRNKSNSVAAMESALSSINVLQSFCDERGLDLTDRFLKREFFSLANWMRSVTIANRILARDVLNRLKKLDPSLPKSPVDSSDQMNADLPRIDRERTEDVKLLAPTIHPRTEQETWQGLIDKLAVNFKTSPL